jgi:hypothetical protein
MSMKFFAISNLSSHDVEVVDPTTSDLLAPLHSSKEERRAWQTAVTTQHLFYSACEGLAPSLRVSERNESYKLHGLVCDYDSKISDAELGGLAKNAAPGLLPVWISHTFSGGARLVFEFKEPVYVDNPDIADCFLKELRKELRLKYLLPGFDDKSLNLTQYFELGRGWQRVPDAKPIPSNVLGLVFYRAAGKKTIRGEGPQIPIEAVAAEVERRWPGRINGEFTVGLRTPLFWIDDGIDRIGAQVGDFGMICYSDRAHKSFFHWGEILGSEFVRNYEAAREGAAMEDWDFDGDGYWRRLGNGQWSRRNKVTCADDLRTEYHLSSKPNSKTDTASDVLRVMNRIRNERAVAGAMPMLYSRERYVFKSGQKYLSIATTRPIQPADNGDPTNFPWLYQFFEHVWDPTCPDQKLHFLAWFKRFYESALGGNLKAGQAVYIAGPPDIGKTLVSWRVVGAALGGHAPEGIDYLKGDTTFNKELAENPLIAIDDSELAEDIMLRKRFTSMLKKLVANPMINYHRKNIDGVSIPWKGRILVTCNLTPDSLSILPRLGPDNLNKFHLFKFGEEWFPDYQVEGGIEAQLQKELPYALRWLLDLDVSAVTSPKGQLTKTEAATIARFGMLGYHAPYLLDHIAEESSEQNLREMIYILWRNAGKKEPEWFNMQQLREALWQYDQNRHLLNTEFGGKRLAHAIAKLPKNMLLSRRGGIEKRRNI